MKNRTRKLTLGAMLCAAAFAAAAVGRVPVVLFLKYDPKDVVIALSGFMLGPAAAGAVASAASVLEMLCVGTTGVIGCMMNILSSCCFACTAAFIYQRRPGALGAGLGLIAGCAAMTGVMLLWNYWAVPLYMGQPRAEVAGLLLPVFLPFNLVKGALNGALAFLLYRPVWRALERAGLAPQESPLEGKGNALLACAAAGAAVTCGVFLLAMHGV